MSLGFDSPEGLYELLAEATQAVELLLQILGVAVVEDPGQGEHVADSRLAEAPVAVQGEGVAGERHAYTLFLCSG